MIKYTIVVLIMFTSLLCGCSKAVHIGPTEETTKTTEYTDEATQETETDTEPATTVPHIVETTVPETSEQIFDPIDIEPHELEYLAIAIYCEAGSDRCCDNCRRRVADVILNRVADDRYPDSILGVLRQFGQYGTFGWTGVVWPDMSYRESEKKAVEKARRIAAEVISGQHSELYGQNYIWQAEFVQGYDWIYCCGIYYGKG